MKQLNITFLLTMLMSMTGIQAFAHDIEVANADGVTIYYKYINNSTELAVTCRGGAYYYYDNDYSGNVVIPETVTYNGKTYSVTSIGYESFRGCAGLTAITIPNSVTSIGDDAFNGCTGLTEVTIPNSVTSIGGAAFYNTAWYNNQPDGLIYAGKMAYSYKGIMPENTSIVLEDGTLGIADVAFSHCSGLTSVTIPNSVTSIGDRAFQGCSGLTSVTIPNSVTSIGNSAFDGCTGLTEVNISNSVTSIGSGAFLECTGLTEVTIPNSVTSIGNSAFYGCTGLTEVTIGNSVTSIGDYAFYGCTGLTSITIGNSVTSIGYRAFKDCTGLTEVTIPNSVTSIGSSAFYNTHLESVTIGTGVLTIDINAFSYPTKVIWLTNTPPSGYTYAKGTVNYVANDLYTSLSNKTVYPFLSSIFEVDGVKYVPVSPSERTCDAIDCLYDESAENINIGETVSNKGISLTVKQIHPYALFGNRYIKEVNLTLRGNIGESAFKGCALLTSAELGEGITSIGSSAFSGCEKLQGIVIPNAVTTIGSSAFRGCSSIPDISIPSSVTDIGDDVFYGCTSLSKVTIEDREEMLNLGSNGSNPIFSSCPLDEVYIGGNIAYSTSSNKGYSPFYRNTSLRTVVITDKETEISENEFYGCTNLKNVTIGDGVTTIGNWAFSGCASLDYFAFGSSLETIGKEAFSDCTAVTKIISRATTPPACGSQALDDINKWNCTLEVPQGTLSAYQAAEQWKEFFFIQEGEASTGISNTVVQPTPSAPTYHTLDGREVKNPGKGIYIVNGKKVMIK